MKAGTGVKVASSVKVGIAVAMGLGVHVDGRVNGASVDIGCELRTELPQAERKRNSKNKLGITFFCNR